MSKKFEAIKKAVFYSEQKPELLAEILVGSVSDVATSVGITGDKSIAIPTGDTANTATYTAKVLSQYGDEMSGTVSLALKASVTGVSISDGTVSVDKTATADNFTLVATSGSMKSEKVVSLIHS